MPRTPLALDLEALDVDTFALLPALPEDGALLADWGSNDSNCIWSNCATRQAGACESLQYGPGCPSLWPNCIESRFCPV